MSNKINYVCNKLSVAQITMDSLVHDIEKALVGREAFEDTSDLNERLFQGDVFEDILGEHSEIGVPRLSPKAIEQIEVLIEQVQEYDYIFIL